MRHIGKFENQVKLEIPLLYTLYFFISLLNLDKEMGKTFKCVSLYLTLANITKSLFPLHPQS